MNTKPNCNINKFPANLLKFNTYMKKVSSLEDAASILRHKHLAFGEPGVVCYDKTNEEGHKSAHILFAIGSMDPENPYFYGLIADASTGEVVTLEEILPELRDIEEEFGGKSHTEIRWTNNPEEVNLDSSFGDGNIVLGQAATMTVADSLDASEGLTTVYYVGSVKNQIDSSIEDLSDIVAQKVGQDNLIFENGLDSSWDGENLRITLADTIVDPSSNLTFSGEHQIGMKWIGWD